MVSAVTSARPSTALSHRPPSSTRPNACPSAPEGASRSRKRPPPVPSTCPSDEGPRDADAPRGGAHEPSIWLGIFFRDHPGAPRALTQRRDEPPMTTYRIYARALGLLLLCGCGSEVSIGSHSSAVGGVGEPPKA